LNVKTLKSSPREVGIVIASWYFRPLDYSIPGPGHFLSTAKQERYCFKSSLKTIQRDLLPELYFAAYFLLPTYYCQARFGVLK
jgi:hypothetical protein